MVTWAVVVVVVLLFLYLTSRKPRGFPPGPPRVPLVGFLPFMETHLPHKHMARLSQKYGPAVGLYFGQQPVVVANGWDAVRESLLNDDLNGRPWSAVFTVLYKGEERGVMFVEGEFWREQRRFMLHHLRNLGFAKKSHESIMHDEINDLIKEMKHMITSVDLQSALGVSSINILWAVMGGTGLGRQDPQLEELVKRLNRVFRNGQINGGLVSVFLPLRHLQSQNSRFNTVVNGRLRVLEFIQKAVDDHKATNDPDNPRDFMDIYLNEINNNKDPDSSFSEKQLVAACLDVFSAGVETSSATVSFAILLVMHHPHVAKAICRELDEVVGRDRLPAIKDRQKLVYTDATLTEVLRFRSTAPFTVGHKASRDTTLMGHRVPAGTTVLNNLYSVHMDPQYWGDPFNFRPERFINADGSLRKDERLIPFGKGKRVCPGESLARMTTFLMFAALMQHFTFTLDPATPIADTEGKSGFTLGPPEFSVLTQPRF